MSFPINGAFTQDQIDKLNAISKDQKNNKKLKDNELGQDAFLKILTTQLQYQDPMSPMDNKDFIAQMAQFTSVEQMTAMSKNMSLSNEIADVTNVMLNDLKKQLVYTEGEGDDAKEVSYSKTLLEQNKLMLDELKKLNTAISQLNSGS